MPSLSAAKLDEALKVNLLQELGLENLSIKDQEEFLINFGTILNQRIALRLFQELPEEKTKELELLISNFADDPDKLYMFYRQEIRDFDEVVKEEIAKYKAELLKRFSPLAKGK